MQLVRNTPLFADKCIKNLMFVRKNALFADKRFKYLMFVRKNALFADKRFKYLMFVRKTTPFTDKCSKEWQTGINGLQFYDIIKNAVMCKTLSLCWLVKYPARRGRQDTLLKC